MNESSFIGKTLFPQFFYASLSLLSSYVCFFSSAQRRSEEILKFIESTFHFPLISHSQHKLMRESKEYAHLKSIRSGVKDGRMKISARLSGANIYSSDWKSLWLNAHFFLLQQRVEIFFIASQTVWLATTFQLPLRVTVEWM